MASISKTTFWLRYMVIPRSDVSNGSFPLHKEMQVRHMLIMMDTLRKNIPQEEAMQLRNQRKTP